MQKTGIKVHRYVGKTKVGTKTTSIPFKKPIPTVNGFRRAAAWALVVVTSAVSAAALTFGIRVAGK